MFNQRFPLSFSAPIALILTTVLAAPAQLLAQGEIRGSVRNQKDQAPLADVEILVAGTRLKQATGDNGTFVIPGVAVGTYALEARRPGFVVARMEAVSVSDRQVTEVSFELVPAPVSLDEIVVTPGRFTILQRQPEAVQFLSREESEQLPHLADDLFRAIALLPGSAAGDISAKFNIRGGADDEVLFILDGQEIFEPFHLKDFQSVFSVIDSKAIGGVDYLTGGFPAEYGGRMSGVIDVTSASPAGKARHTVGVSFLTAYFLSEGTFGDGRGQWLASIRRGYLDFALDLVGEDFDFDPEYYDAMAKVSYALGEKTVLSGHLLGAFDDAEFDNDGDERALASYGNAYAWVNLKTAWTPKLYSRTVLSFGTVDRDRRGIVNSSEVNSRVEDDRSFDVFELKQDWTSELFARLYLKWGFDVRKLDAEYRYGSLSTVFDPLFTGGDPVFTRRLLLPTPSGNDERAYLAGRIGLSSRLTVELGVRWDRQTYIEPEDDQISPRINLAYNLGPRSTLRAAWGRFHQPQGIHELQVPDGVDTFFPTQRSEHRVIGFEHTSRQGLSLRVDLYQKEVSNPRPRFENLFEPIEILPEAEEDRIRIAPDRAESEGLEILLKSRAGGKLSWWASYALSSADDEIDGETVPRSWDQTHAARFDINARLGEKWNVNLVGVYHSGWPTTGVTAEAIANPDGSFEIRQILGPRNREEYPDYFRVDVRASRHVPIRRGELTFFLEVTNLLDRDNVRSIEDFDFSLQPDGSVNVRAEEETWLPRLPSFGLSWEF